MTAHDLHVMTRPRRRTHLVYDGAGAPMCGTRTPIESFHPVPVSISGGATRRLRDELQHHMGPNSCIPCTRIALAMMALYAARDGGTPW